MKVGMEFFIDYAHHLEGHELCGRPHGHTAKIIVEVVADNSAFNKFRGYEEIKSYEDSMLIDFRDMKREVNDVLNKLDHKDLNTMFKYPSSEVVIAWLWGQLEYIFDAHRDCFLHSVRFYEGNGKYVEIVFS